MPRPQSKNFDSAWAEVIQNAMANASEEKPAGEGWKTVKEFADDYSPKIGRAHAAGILLNLVKRNVVERQKGKSAGRWAFYYRPVVTSAKTSAK
jgi:hypothetical protein